MKKHKQQVVYNPLTGALTLMIDGKVLEEKRTRKNKAKRTILHAMEWNMISTASDAKVNGLYVYNVEPSGAMHPNQPDLLATRLASFKWPDKAWWDSVRDADEDFT